MTRSLEEYMSVHDHTYQVGNTRVDRRAATGLGGMVVEALRYVDGVSAIDFRGVDKCRGISSISLPSRWKPGEEFEVIIVDGERGRRRIAVRTKKTGAVRRILGKKLLDARVNVKMQ